MSDDQNIRSLSQLMSDVASHFSGDHISVAEILEAFHERGFGVLLFIFAAPMALPLPVPPGINVLLATPLLLLTTQQMLGRHTIWMPTRIKNKTIRRTKFEKALGTVIPWIKKLEFLIRPRLGFMTRGIFSNLIGLFGLVMALSVCIPVPLSNTVPSFGIAMMAIGVLMRDGLAILVGAIVGLSWVGALVFLSHAGLKALLGG